MIKILDAYPACLGHRRWTKQKNLIFYSSQAFLVKIAVIFAFYEAGCYLSMWNIITAGFTPYDE